MKVFCAVGNMDRDFNRFVRKIADLDNAPNYQITFQSGYSLINHFEWKRTEIHPFLSSSEFKRFIFEADLVICHAGVGVITDCLKQKKMPIIMTRSVEFKEHVNDHQVDFAARYAAEGLFHLMNDETDIVNFIQNIDLSVTPQREFIHDLAGLRSNIHHFLREKLNKCP